MRNFRLTFLTLAIVFVFIWNSPAREGPTGFSAKLLLDPHRPPRTFGKWKGQFRDLCSRAALEP